MILQVKAFSHGNSRTGICERGAFYFFFKIRKQMREELKHFFYNDMNERTLPQQILTVLVI